MKTKKLLSVFLSAVMVFALLIPTFANEQTEPDIYTEIFTAEDFSNIRNNLDGKYKLMNDIDLSVYESWEPVGTPFSGKLDGNGYSVLNLSIKNCSQGKKCGLFSNIRNGLVKDLKLINVDINLQNTDSYSESICVGSLAGTVSGATIDNCVVTGKINIDGFSSGDVGGLYGYEYMSTSAGCINYSDISVSADQVCEMNVGGIAGTSTALNKCGNFGDITVSSRDSEESNNSSYIGGICGYPYEYGNVINNCYNRGSISVDFSTPTTHIGGLMGEAWIIRNSYNAGDINYPEKFNGFYGAVAGNIVSFLTAAVVPELKTENVYYTNKEIIPAFKDENIPDDFTKKPFDQIHLLTEEEFGKQESFVGFDFEDVWKMEENGYPVFKNQPKFVAEKHNIILEAGKNVDIGAVNGIWETTDPEVALLSADGFVMAQEAGEAVIKTEYPYGYIKEYHITVTDPDFVDTPDPNEPTAENSVESAEIVSVPLKNRIIFGYGSPNTPEGIVLKLRYKDGTEKTETIIRTDDGCYAGEERIFGGVHLTVVEFGKQTETLYVNDESVSVEYDYFVIPPLRSVIYKLLDTFFGFLFPIRMF